MGTKGKMTFQVSVDHPLAHFDFEMHSTSLCSNRVRVYSEPNSSNCAPSKMCQYKLDHMNYLQLWNKSHKVHARYIENSGDGSQQSR